MNTFNLKSVKIMDLLLHFQIYFTQEPLISIKKNEGLITAISPSSYMCLLLEICKILLHVSSWSNKNFLELLLTCTCRDRMSADNILLKTFESIDAATDRCLAEYLGSLLE